MQQNINITLPKSSDGSQSQLLPWVQEQVTRYQKLLGEKRTMHSETMRQIFRKPLIQSKRALFKKDFVEQKADDRPKKQPEIEANEQQPQQPQQPQQKQQQIEQTLHNYTIAKKKNKRWEKLRKKVKQVKKPQRKIQDQDQEDLFQLEQQRKNKLALQKQERQRKQLLQKQKMQFQTQKQLLKKKKEQIILRNQQHKKRKQQKAQLQRKQQEENRRQQQQKRKQEESKRQQQQKRKQEEKRKQQQMRKLDQERERKMEQMRRIEKKKEQQMMAQLQKQEKNRIQQQQPQDQWRHFNGKYPLLKVSQIHKKGEVLIKGRQQPEGPTVRQFITRGDGYAYGTRVGINLTYQAIKQFKEQKDQIRTAINQYEKGDGKIVFKLGDHIAVILDQYKGIQYVGIRKYGYYNGQFTIGREGINVRQRQWDQLVDAVFQI